MIKKNIKNKDNKTTDKSLISPEKANEFLKRPEKKISVGKNDIVERDDTIISIDDGRQLLK